MCVFIADGYSHSLNLDYGASELIRCKKNSESTKCFIHNDIEAVKHEKITSYLNLNPNYLLLIIKNRRIKFDTEIEITTLNLGQNDQFTNVLVT